RNAIYVVALLLLVASAVLAYSFFTRDFGVRYVAVHSNLAMPLHYVISAFYAGQEGSLLYWSTLLGVFGAGMAFVMHRRHADLIPYAIAVVLGILTFFLAILVFVTNPLERLAVAMPDGRGLNPLLQDPGMLIHPPMLLAGYVSWTIPFAIVIGALASGRPGVEWARAVRTPTLIAWTMHSVGLVLGGWWAYHVLGWGGYWGWDPVENVALLPWLAGTAFLHSIMVVERRGKLKVWTISLIIATFALSIFATFIVRSGILSSVHNFAISGVGPMFLGFFVVSLGGSIALLILRLPRLRDEEGFDAVISRESGFLLNNLLFVSIAFATFWGTVYPMISEAIGNERITVGAPFYVRVNGPLFLALILLMGVGPLLAWRKTSGGALWRNLRLPGILAITTTFAIAGVTRDLVAAAAFGACALVVGAVDLEYTRGSRIRRRYTRETYPAAVVGLVSRDRRRYGGYLVHLSVVILAIGIIASSGFQSHRQVNLNRGESVDIAGYSLTYLGTAELQEPGKEVVVSRLALTKDGVFLGEATPRTQYYAGFETQPTSRVAVISRWREDIYVFQGGVDATSATFSIFVNPLVTLVWVGGALLVLATLVSGWPTGRRQRAIAWAPAGAAVTPGPRSAVPN
ncbi:MAG: heme lyase CcmF/NrfE family subunit, partial [Chloroflexi bacterium]|nr:heme lyase CcmF/NrfE family subunit [Chloroflexota bacterium]